MAVEMGCRIKLASGKIKATEARLLLLCMADGDILLIEEIHQLVQSSKRDAEWLLNYMQDGLLLGPLGAEEVPKVTIIGCTTDKGRLPEAILDRFKLEPDLEDYTDSQAADIALLMGNRIFTPPLAAPTAENCAENAMAANNNPRRIKTLLEALRDFALVDELERDPEVDYDLGPMLASFGLTPDGLTPHAQQYLTTLLTDFNGESVGAATLKYRLQEPGGLEFTDRVVMAKGLGLVEAGRRIPHDPNASGDEVDGASTARGVAGVIELLKEAPLAAWAARPTCYASRSNRTRLAPCSTRHPAGPPARCSWDRGRRPPGNARSGRYAVLANVDDEDLQWARCDPRESYTFEQFTRG